MNERNYFTIVHLEKPVDTYCEFEINYIRVLRHYSLDNGALIQQLNLTVVLASVVKTLNVVRRYVEQQFLYTGLCKVNRDRHLLRTNLSHRIAVLHIYDVFAHPLETIRFLSVIIFYGDDPSLLAFVFVSITVATNCLLGIYLYILTIQWNGGK